MMHTITTHGHDERRSTVALLLALALLTGTVTAQAQGTQTVWAQFEDLELDPVRVRSGDAFDMTFTVRNILDVPMDDMHLELLLTEPFEGLGASLVYIGDMGPNATAPASFRLQVDEDAPAGVYPLTVIVSMEATAQAVQGTRFLEMKTTGYSFTKIINVRVHGEPGVVGAVAAGDLRDIHPGDRFSATLRLVNNGTDVAEDLWVEAQGTDTLSPEWGFARQFAGDLPPGAAATLTLVGTVDDGAWTGDHVLPVSLTWSGDEGTYTSSVPVRVSVRGYEPLIDVAGVASDPPVIVPGDPFTLTVRVVNAASDSADLAKDVVVVVTSTGPLAMAAAGQEQVLGTLPGGAAATVVFTGEASLNATAGEHALPISLSWVGDARVAGMMATVPVTVALSDPSLAVSAVGSRPTSLRPGEPFTLTLRVVNTGAAPHHKAQDVVVSASSTDAVRFHAAGREQVLGTIPPGGVATATFAGEVADEATAGDHVVPIRLIHRYGVVEGTITLTVADAADFSLGGRNPPLLRDDTRQPVSFTLRNTGTTTAEQVSLTLMAAYPITPSGRTTYVPALPPGEEVEVRFHADVDAEATPQDYPLEVVIAWQEGRERMRRQQTEMVALAVSPNTPRLRWEIPLGVALVLLVIMRLRMHNASKGMGTGSKGPSTAGPDDEAVGTEKKGDGPGKKKERKAR